MIGRDFHHEANEPSRDFDPLLEESLREDVSGFASAPAPDFTRSIMGRLGYMRVNPRVARRARLRAWSQRAGVILILAISMGLGWRMFEASPEARHPTGPTIHDALGNDLQRQQDRLGTVIQRIRSIAPAPPPQREIDPLRDRLRDPLKDDVNKSPALPHRWV